MKKLLFIGRKNKEIVEIAKEKGYSEVFFIKEISSIDEKEYLDFKEYNSCLLNIENLETLRRAIDKSSHKFENIFILGLNDIINRISLENKKVFGIISPEFNRKFDYTHYRNSGLNQVLIKVAKEKKKLIIEDLSFLKSDLDKKIKAQILGKIMQNYTLSMQILKKKVKETFILTFIVFSKKEIEKFKDTEEFYDGLLINLEK